MEAFKSSTADLPLNLYIPSLFDSFKVSVSMDSVRVGVRTLETELSSKLLWLSDLLAI
jgi:hypothetical protein